MSIKRLSAGLAATVMMFSGTVIPYSAEVLSSCITAYAAEPDSFITGAYDLKYCEAYDGSNADNSFNMAGRTFHQGFVMASNWGSDISTVTMNVEGAQTLKFSVGHVDDRGGSTSTVNVFVDNTKKKQITVDTDSNLTYIELPVSGASKVTISVERTGGSAIGIGDIRTDDNKVNTPQTAPSYGSSEELLQAAYNTNYLEIYDGTDEYKNFNMAGRTYYQGMVMSSSWGSDVSTVTFNVERVKSFTCDIGHLDNGHANTAKLEVYGDSKKINEFTLDAEKPVIEDVTFDLEGINNLRFKLVRENGGSSYVLGDIRVDSYGVAIPSYTPENEYVEEMIMNAFDLNYADKYQAQDEFTSFNMQGRDYYQGITMISNWGSDVSKVTFNVENVDTFRCDMGHIAGTGMNTAVMAVYVDDVKKDEVTLDYNKNIREYSIDVKDGKLLRFELSRNNGGSGYALGDIKTDSIKPKIPHWKPEYADDNDFVFNGYDGDYRTVYNGQDDFNTFSMGGKSYSQGVVMDSNWGSDVSGIYFNTESVDSVTVTVGHLDESGANPAKLIVMSGEAENSTLQEIALTPDMLSADYTFDTKGLQQLYFRLERKDGGSGYALANFRIVKGEVTQPEAEPDHDKKDPIEPVDPKPEPIDPQPEPIDPQPEPIDPEPSDDIALGDINGDGDVNVTDVTKLAAHVKSIRSLAGDELKRADVNGDGDVNVTDLMKVAAHVKGIKSLS
ncbi:NPCBM/NEW2 domain-containing protein [Ruminococcus sp.]|uniref:dockerin type I repeat-containing protein n=1 Tax=Ruminococcus sp. TaxID=41978 RepID=UPI0025F9706F|nr:NPCBM/NEW2 domain-containing protein [Ruminococcus sp.]MBQ8966203.1 NPCBM/NEW2 domain-containing protein [Ruminococcus sp.]